MAEQALIASQGGRYRFEIVVANNTNTIAGFAAGVIIERFICTTSSSGTLAIADGEGTPLPTLTLVSGTIYELNLPARGTLTLTLTGTTATGTLVLRDPNVPG